MIESMRPEHRRAGSLTVRALRKSDHEEVFVSAGPGGGTAAAYAALAEWVSRNGVQLLQEKAYGLIDHRDRILRARREAFGAAGLDPDLPVTFIEGLPAAEGPFAGLQAWGVRASNGAHRVESVGRARRWSGPGFRMLHVPSLTGADHAGSVERQAEEMFRDAASALEEQGFRYNQVVRTWIYLDHILEWYGDFNRVRTAHHDVSGIGVNGTTKPFPASTGIQGRGTAGKCMMDLLAVDGEGAVEVHPIRKTSRQGRAFSYGSGFSRGMVLSMGGRKVVHVSGTASIDASGATVHQGNPKKQLQETLLNISALLGAEGAGLQDIVQSTLFCKDRATYEVCREALGTAGFPRIDVIADVCRDDLLVEIEAVAAK